MENELQMTLNRLPAPTWNWLKMNESHVAYDRTPVWFSASVEISGDGMVHTKEKVDGWDRIVSGVGRDLDKLGELAGGETDVLETFGQTEETYAVLTYDFPGGDYASCLYLHARENSTLNVTMVLTGGKDQKGSSSVQVKA